MQQHGAVRGSFGAVHCRQVRPDPGRIIGRDLAGPAVDDELLSGFVGQEQSELVGRAVAVHEARRVREAREVFQIDPTGLHQAMNQRQYEQPVRARRYAQPFVGNRVVSGANRIDPDDPRAARLQLADAHLDGV